MLRLLGASVSPCVGGVRGCVCVCVVGVRSRDIYHIRLITRLLRSLALQKLSRFSQTGHNDIFQLFRVIILFAISNFAATSSVHPVRDL